MVAYLQKLFLKGRIEFNKKIKLRISKREKLSYHQIENYIMRFKKKKHTKVKSLIAFLLLVHFIPVFTKSTPIFYTQQQYDITTTGKCKILDKSPNNSPITVKPSWTNKTYKTIAVHQGNWSLSIPTPTAGKPYEITFSNGELLTLKNILIGEVCFCFGQSNMEMPMSGFDRQTAQGRNDIIAKAKPTIPICIYNTDSEERKIVWQFSKTPQEDCKDERLENICLIPHLFKVRNYQIIN